MTDGTESNSLPESMSLSSICSPLEWTSLSPHTISRESRVIDDPNSMLVVLTGLSCDNSTRNMLAVESPVRMAHHTHPLSKPPSKKFRLQLSAFCDSIIGNDDSFLVENALLENFVGSTSIRMTHVSIDFAFPNSDTKNSLPSFSSSS